MKNKTIMLAGLALAVSAFTSIAQPGPGDGPPSHRGGPPGGPGGDQQRPLLPPIVAALDTNHDGVIDAQEIANAAAVLKTLDKNNDGQLTPDEFMPPRQGQAGLRGGPRGGFRGGPGGPQGRGPVGPPPGIGDNSGQQAPLPPRSPIVAALDANHDGVIDAQEIANASAALKTLDKNNDGQLTRDEMMPPQGGPRGQELLPAGPGPRGGFRGGPGGPQGRGSVGPPPGIGENSGQQAPLPPRSPIVAALDANHDGVIDAQEIAHAIAALKTLDRNGDGQLTPDEYMPPRQGQAGLRRGPRGGFRGGLRGGPGGPQGPDGPVSPPDGRGAPPPPEN